MSSGKREQVEIRRTNRIKSLFGKLLGDPMGAIGVLIVASFLITV